MGKDSEGRAEPVQIKLRPKGVGIGFSDNEEEGGENEEEISVKVEREVEREKGFTVRQDFRENRKQTTGHVSYSPPSYEVTASDPFSFTDKVEIIDMTSRGGTSKPAPLSSLLSELTAKKKRERLLLARKQEELDAALRELKRNIEEVQRERVRLTGMDYENEIKREMRSFIDADHENIESVCKNVKQRTESELWDKVVASVMVPMLLESDTCILDQDKMIKIKENVSESLYSQIIYHIWWPSVKRSHFNFDDDSTGWRSVIALLKDWAHLLLDDFLVSFLGNQILIPRLHNSLQSDHFSEQDRGMMVIFEIWDFFSNYLRLPNILSGEIVSWTTQRIQSIQVKRFQSLLEEFQGAKKLFSSDDLKRIEGAWRLRAQRLLQRDLIIDPADQDLLPLECFLKYKELVYGDLKDDIVIMLSEYLIPKLKRCVQSWLKSPQVDYEEVAEWYVAWKEIIPEDLREDDSMLMVGFAQILETINENI